MRLIGNALPAYSKIPGQSPVISLSFLGGIGLTAYFGVFDVCKLEKDSVVVVSGAAGSVVATILFLPSPGDRGVMLIWSMR